MKRLGWIGGFFMGIGFATLLVVLGDKPFAGGQGVYFLAIGVLMTAAGIFMDHYDVSITSRSNQSHAASEEG